MKGRTIARAASIIVLACSAANAQELPAIRQLGKLERSTTESLRSAATAVPLRDGCVYVNDIAGRRVLLFDSTLARAVVIADTTTATGSAYGRQAGALIRYRGDSALFIDPASLSMLVLGPTGKIERVMAIPRPNDRGLTLSGLLGAPGFDERGRLVYFSGPVAGMMIRWNQTPPPSEPGANAFLAPMLHPPDSAAIVRVDLATRLVDTVAAVRVSKTKNSFNTDAQGIVRSIGLTTDVHPLVDDWTVCPDGSIAIVRGRDYHVDRLGNDGHWTSAPKMPFTWKHLSDEQKTALIDSAVKAEQERLGANNSSATSAYAPYVVGRPALSEIPDYVPPFTRGAVYADVDGNLWIRTSTMVQGQPVYDIVNRQGKLFDRVQLPSFRTIAGFGYGVVYMAVKDSAGAVHLERARTK